MKNTAVFGILSDRAHAESAIDALMRNGFRGEDISVFLADNAGTKDLAHEKHTKAPEGATTGASAGAVVGGTLGLLAGVGMIAIPGLGPFIAAGPIMGLLAGAGTGGIAGGIIGALIGMGMPEYEARRYEGLVKQGRALISVHCDDGEWVSRAKKVLEGAGADDISSTSESSADYAKSDKPHTRFEGVRR